MMSAAAVDQLRFGAHTWRLLGPYLGEVNLCIGAGRNTEPGFINHDRVEGPNIDVVLDLERCAHDIRLPGFGTGSVDCVLASHVLEHITHLIPVMREIHRVLKPGGVLFAVTPHASSAR